MGKHMEEWAQDTVALVERMQEAPLIVYERIATLARAILADAEEREEARHAEIYREISEHAWELYEGGPPQPAHPYYWRPWETRPRGEWVLALLPGKWATMCWTNDDHMPRPTHWMPLPPEPPDD